jgi:hypothetical protein
MVERPVSLNDAYEGIRRNVAMAKSGENCEGKEPEAQCELHRHMFQALLDFVASCLMSRDCDKERNRSGCQKGYTNDLGSESMKSVEKIEIVLPIAHTHTLFLPNASDHGD